MLKRLLTCVLFSLSLLQLTGLLKELGYTEQMVYKFWIRQFSIWSICAFTSNFELYKFFPEETLAAWTWAKHRINLPVIFNSNNALWELTLTCILLLRNLAKSLPVWFFFYFFFFFISCTCWYWRKNKWNRKKRKFSRR